MKILINDQPLDFTLENERSVGEIADGVSRWLDPAGLVITAGRLGGDVGAHTLDEREAWQDVPIDGVDEIGFTVEDHHTMQLTHLRTLHAYVAQLLSEDQVATAMEPLPDLLEGLRAILGGRHARVYGAQLQEWQQWLRTATANSAAPPPRAAIDERLRALDELVVELESELSDPVGALRVHVGELSGARDAIDDVAVWLQSGEDRRAMDTVVAFTDHTQQVMRSLATVIGLQRAQAAVAEPGEAAEIGATDEQPRIDGKDLRSFYGELNGHLREITTAFEDVDSVLIGDLLEYEVGPRIDMLVSFATTIADSA
jgi:hypothetical protein